MKFFGLLKLPMTRRLWFSWFKSMLFNNRLRSHKFPFFFNAKYNDLYCKKQYFKLLFDRIWFSWREMAALKPHSADSINIRILSRDRTSDTLFHALQKILLDFYFRSLILLQLRFLALIFWLDYFWMLALSAQSDSRILQIMWKSINNSFCYFPKTNSLVIWNSILKSSIVSFLCISRALPVGLRRHFSPLPLLTSCPW